MRFLFYFLLVSNTAFCQDVVTVANNENDLHRYSLFLKGEYHEYRADNEQSVLLLAKYLYTHHNVRYLVFEWGPDFVYLANRYLQTKTDLMPGKKYLNFSKAFWDSLALFNQDKASNERLQMKGFDFNRSLLTALAFHEMVKNKKPYSDPALQSLIEKIITWKDTAWSWEGQKIFVQQMAELRPLCKSQQAALEAYFGDDWSAFFTIVNHEVDSNPMVKRDQSSIGYVKNFLATKGDGNVLFNLGVNHTYFDGAGMGSLLQNDELYRGKVCSIYPYHRIPGTEKEKYQQDQDEDLTAALLTELQAVAPYSLVSLEQKGIYPKKNRKIQWVYVVPKAKQP